MLYNVSVCCRLSFYSNGLYNSTICCIWYWFYCTLFHNTFILKRTMPGVPSQWFRYTFEFAGKKHLNCDAFLVLHSYVKMILVPFVMEYFQENWFGAHRLVKPQCLISHISTAFCKNMVDHRGTDKDLVTKKPETVKWTDFCRALIRTAPSP